MNDNAPDLPYPASVKVIEPGLRFLGDDMHSLVPLTSDQAIYLMMDLLDMVRRRGLPGIS